MSIKIYVKNVIASGKELCDALNAYGEKGGIQAILSGNQIKIMDATYLWLPFKRKPSKSVGWRRDVNADVGFTGIIIGNNGIWNGSITISSKPNSVFPRKLDEAEAQINSILAGFPTR